MSIALLIRKLAPFAAMSAEQCQLLESSVTRVVRFDPDQDIVKAGETPEEIPLLAEGWASRYKDLSEGTRQILAYLIPGDLCGVLHAQLRVPVTHPIGALSPCKVVFFDQKFLLSMDRRSVQLGRALAWCSLVDQAILSEWLSTNACQRADRRGAHLICEMFHRLTAVGLVENGAFEFPLTQGELADTLGISAVHMNRTLQLLRQKGLLNFAGKRMQVLNLRALEQFADFDPTYLHQEREARTGRKGRLNPRPSGTVRLNRLEARKGNP